MMRLRKLKGQDMMFLMECVRCMHDEKPFPKVPEKFKREVEMCGGLTVWLINQREYMNILNAICKDE